MRNDERMKLVNDMVTGIRTIKSYAWENHYSEKVRAQRSLQVKKIFWLNMVGSLGFSIYQNVGLIGVLIILLSKWYNGELLNLGDSFTLVALIYYLFFSVNSMTYYTMNTINMSLAVIYRLSEVFRMEEHSNTRRDHVVQGEPAIDIIKGEYAWGFRVAENQEKNRKANKAKLDVQKVDDSVLKDITFKLMPDELLVVVGKIGSGKTSLLYSIMDETVKKGGHHKVSGRVAYVE